MTEPQGVAEGPMVTQRGAELEKNGRKLSREIATGSGIG